MKIFFLVGHVVDQLLCDPIKQLHWICSFKTNCSSVAAPVPTCQGGDQLPVPHKAKGITVGLNQGSIIF